MKRPRREVGLSSVEFLLSASLSVVVLVGANSMLVAGGDVARSTNDVGVASSRVESGLDAAADALRRGSLDSALRLDGTAFADATTDVGFQIRPVVGYHGAPMTSPLGGLRWDVGSGELLRVDGPIESVLARGVTDFSVSRTGHVFTLSLTARSGPPDGRQRTATGTRRVAARNP